MKFPLKASFLAIFLSALFFIPVSPSHAEDIPMTIDGQINCANPANAITTTCRGEAPPPPVNTPPAAANNESPGLQNSSSAIDCQQSSNKSLPICQPMTINGEINCANPNNSITTTCWEAAKNPNNTINNVAAVDCKNEAFREFPVCSGVKPEAVLTQEKAQLDLAAQQEIQEPVKVVTKKKITITCIKGKTIKKLSGASPKCPAGFKIK
jgi:hypothetical protein